MTISKKLTAGLLTGMLMAGSLVPSFAALPTDALDSPYGEAIETLGALDIMIGDGDGLFRPEASIRRSEFAKVAVEAMGLGNLAAASNHQTKFPDVVENHWANGYINVAADQGIVIGDDEANFRPDDAITYAEAMTVLVRIIGHEPAALKKGGFPNGYLSIGNQLGISKNAVASANQDVIRGMIAQMTFNALTVKMMEQTGFGNNEKYEVVDKTLLFDVLDVTKAEGQISAVGISSISGSSELRDNEVRIGDKTFRVSEEAMPAVRNLLGFHVTYYVREMENGKDELILARANENKNNSTTIATGNIEKVTENGDGSVTVEYWIDRSNDRDTKELTIKDGAQMIFNGKAIAFDKALLQPESGRIVSLDVDGDDVHDLIFITSFTNLVVEAVMEKSNKITDKYGNPSLTLDPENKDVKFTITRGGQLINISDLAEWDVLSIAKSKDGSIISVEVSSNSVTGKVTEIVDGKRVIDGKEYEIAKNYQEEIRLNDEGIFYLDVEGKIAAVDTKTVLSGNYAYAVMGALSKNFDSYLELKVYNKEGETVILKSGEKIKFNGVSGKTPEAVLEALESEGTFVPQLITYEVNKDGVLREISTATDLSGSGTINKNKFSLNASGEMTFKKATNKLGAYNISENTLILNIPAGSTDTDDFSVEKLSFFENNETYNVFVYDAGEDFSAKAIIVTDATATTSVEAPIAIVDKITETYNESGETVQKLYVYQNGELVSFEASADELLEKGEDEALERGDVVQLKLNNKNQITSLRLVFEASEKGTEFTTTEGDLTVLYGKVTKKFASSINLQVNGGTIANYALDNVLVYEFDSAKKKNPIRVVDTGEITQYDEADPSRVLVKIYKDVVQEIVIVK